MLAYTHTYFHSCSCSLNQPRTWATVNSVSLCIIYILIFSELLSFQQPTWLRNLQHTVAHLSKPCNLSYSSSHVEKTSKHCAITFSNSSDGICIKRLVPRTCKWYKYRIYFTAKYPAESSYNDIGLYNTPSTASDIQWYQLIAHC
jgi:hypothetical protein